MGAELCLPPVSTGGCRLPLRAQSPRSGATLLNSCMTTTTDKECRPASGAQARSHGIVFHRLTPVARGAAPPSGVPNANAPNASNFSAFSALKLPDSLTQSCGHGHPSFQLGLLAAPPLRTASGTSILPERLFTQDRLSRQPVRGLRPRAFTSRGSFFLGGRFCILQVSPERLSPSAGAR
jgi:hypothetical protein